MPLSLMLVKDFMSNTKIQKREAATAVNVLLCPISALCWVLLYCGIAQWIL